MPCHPATRSYRSRAASREVEQQELAAAVGIHRHSAWRAARRPTRTPFLPKVGPPSRASGRPADPRSRPPKAAPSPAPRATRRLRRRAVAGDDLKRVHMPLEQPPERQIVDGHRIREAAAAHQRVGRRGSASPVRRMVARRCRRGSTRSLMPRSRAGPARLAGRSACSQRNEPRPPGSTPTIRAANASPLRHLGGDLRSPRRSAGGAFRQSSGSGAVPCPCRGLRRRSAMPRPGMGHHRVGAPRSRRSERCGESAGSRPTLSDKVLTVTIRVASDVPEPG